MVRLQGTEKVEPIIYDSSFNSKMVRLQDRDKHLRSNPFALFQFQNGAIASLRLRQLKPLGFWFQFQNGAIARVLSDRETKELLLFQFQNGAIARRRRIRLRMLSTKFQFQNGAIASPLHGCQRLRPRCFNSKMVRLQVMWFFAAMSVLMFQFQNGAIASSWTDCRRCQPKYVSIPKWCDCKK